MSTATVKKASPLVEFFCNSTEQHKREVYQRVIAQAIASQQAVLTRASEITKACEISKA